MGSRSSWSAVVLLASACTRPLVGDGAGDSSSTGGETSSSSETSTTAPSSDATSSTPMSSTAVDTSSESTDALPLPDVGFPGCPNDWQPPQCWASVCDEFFCGERGSMFDAGGCPRVVCESDAECPASHYCNARMRAGSCFGYGPESCEFSSNQCVCGGGLGCGGDPRGFCLDRVEFPPEQACYALGIECEYLDPWFVDGYWATFEVLDDMSARRPRADVAVPERLCRALPRGVRGRSLLRALSGELRLELPARERLRRHLRCGRPELRECARVAARRGSSGLLRLRELSRWGSALRRAVGLPGVNHCVRVINPRTASAPKVSAKTTSIATNTSVASPR